MIEPVRLDEINRQTVDRSNMFYWQVDRPTDMQEFVEIFMGRHEKFDENKVAREIEAALQNVAGDYSGVKVKRLIGNSDYKSGSVNVNRLVELNDGRELVIRMHPAGLHNGYFDVEAAAMDKVRQFLPTPHIVTVRHNTADGGYDFILMEKMPGENMKNYLAIHSEAELPLVQNMGRRMAELHKIAIDGFGFFDNQYARKTGKLRGIHDSFRHHVLAALPENLNVLVDSKYISVAQSAKITELISGSKLIECAAPKLLHNDMADWNVLTDGTELTAILDWDECFGGDPVADIACWSLFFQPERLVAFLDGYKKITDLGKDFDGKLHIYRLRYVVSKLSMRHRKLGLQNDDIMPGLVKAGMQALKDESEYFNL